MAQQLRRGAVRRPLARAVAACCAAAALGCLLWSVAYLLRNAAHLGAFSLFTSHSPGGCILTVADHAADEILTGALSVVLDVKFDAATLLMTSSAGHLYAIERWSRNSFLGGLAAPLPDDAELYTPLLAPVRLEAAGPSLRPYTRGENLAEQVST